MKRFRLFSAVLSVSCMSLATSFAQMSPAAAANGVVVTAPANNSVLGSPVTFTASAATTTCAKGIVAMEIYVDSVLKYNEPGATINTQITATSGKHVATVKAWTDCKSNLSTSVSFTVDASVTPSVTISANPTSISSGTSSLLTIAATNATTVTLTGSDGSTYPIANTGGTQSVSPAATTIYTAQATGTSSTVSSSATVTVTSPFSISPAILSFAQGSTQQFAATSTASNGTKTDVTALTTWSAGNSAVASISTAGLATAVAVGSTTVTGTYNGLTATTPVTVTAAPGTGVNIPTFHVDVNRSGLNAAETILTPANVQPQTFGKLFSYSTDGYVYGEPLLMSNITINGAVHNVLYAATENDSVYAFDADTFGTGVPLWQVSLLKTGETAKLNADILPVQGVTSTPVIDPATNTIYIVSAELKGANSSFRLNALDITTGAHKFGSPVTIKASVPGKTKGSVNGVLSLPGSCVQRTALLLANNSIYIGFSHCSTGWLLAYDATTLAQTGVFNAGPNLPGEGPYASAGGIWMGAGGPMADAAGNVYAVTGNGPWDGKTAWADSVLKFDSKLVLKDYFTPDAFQFMNCSDADLGSGGAMLIPGANEVIAGGKMGQFYLLSTANLGQEQAGNVGVVQQIYFDTTLSAPFSKSCTDSAGTHTAVTNKYEFFGTPAFFNGSLYAGMSPTSSTVPGVVRQFTFTGQLVGGGISIQTEGDLTRGTTPFISANGTENGIVWVLDQGLPLQNESSASSTASAATLHAFDAADLTHTLYSSTSTADVPGYGIKFTSPIVGNGKVYISTGHDLVTAKNPKGEIDVYGLH